MDFVTALLIHHRLIRPQELSIMCVVSFDLESESIHMNNSLWCGNHVHSLFMNSETVDSISIDMKIPRLQGAPLQKSPYEYIHEKQKETLLGRTSYHHPSADSLHQIYLENCRTISLVRYPVRIFWETTGKGLSSVQCPDVTLLLPQHVPGPWTSCNLSIRWLSGELF